MSAKKPRPLCFQCGTVEVRQNRPGSRFCSQACAADFGEACAQSSIRGWCPTCHAWHVSHLSFATNRLDGTCDTCRATLELFG